MSSMTMIAMATRMHDALPAASTYARVRLTLPAPRPFAAGVCPQDGNVIRVERPGTGLTSARRSTGSGAVARPQGTPLGTVVTAVRVRDDVMQVQKNSDTRHSGTSVSRPPA